MLEPGRQAADRGRIGDGRHEETPGIYGRQGGLAPPKAAERAFITDLPIIRNKTPGQVPSFHRAPTQETLAGRCIVSCRAVGHDRRSQ